LGREISEQRDYSERRALQIDTEVDGLIQEAYATANKILTENKAKLVRVAEKLIAQETLEGAELEKIFDDSLPSPAPEATTAS
jgi:cell division protease FtsH